MINAKPIFLIPLNVIVPCDPGKAKHILSTLGISTWQFIRHWFAWDKLIMRYRFGRLGPLNFKNELKKIFPVLNRHSNDKIDDVWNQMCDYNEHSTAGFKAIQALIANGYEVYLFSRIDPKHIELITKNFRDASDPSTTTLPGQCHWSFEGNGQRIGHDFVGCLINQIKRKDPSANIQLFYTHPIDPAPIWFIGWFLKPYEKLAFRHAEKGVKALHQRATALGFEVVSCEQNDFSSKLLGQCIIEKKEPAYDLEHNAALTFRGAFAERKEEVEKQPEKQCESTALPRQAEICRIS